MRPNAKMLMAGLLGSVASAGVASASIEVGGDVFIDTNAPNSIIATTTIGTGDADNRIGGVHAADGQDIRIRGNLYTRTNIDGAIISTTAIGTGNARLFLGGISTTD